MLSPPPGPTHKVARRDDLVLELERCGGFETLPLADMISVFCPSEGTMVGPLLMVRVTGQCRRVLVPAETAEQGIGLEKA